MTNRQLIESQIRQKVHSVGAYFPDPELIFQTKTDVNVFPYQRFFRGQIDSTSPRVWEREAGFSPIITSRDTKNDVNQSVTQKSTTCFQLPCTTILPCVADPQNFASSGYSKVYTSP
jgi:hypothetical protein